jgi:hypothetical protein
MSHLTCCECGVRNEGVIRDWHGLPDYADAPRARCWDRDRCADRQREQDGRPPFLITCGACGARIPRAQATRHHEHVGGQVNAVTRWYCRGEHKGEEVPLPAR